MIFKNVSLFFKKFNFLIGKKNLVKIYILFYGIRNIYMIILKRVSVVFN